MKPKLNKLFNLLLMGFIILGTAFNVFAETDVTDKVQLIKSSIRYDRRAGTSYLNVSVKNISQDVLLTPVKVIIDSISSTSVTVANADGVTEDGKPYFNYSTETGQLLVGGSIDTKKWVFENKVRARFSYSVVVLGTLPEVVQEIGPEGGIIETDHGLIVDIKTGCLTEQKQITATSVAKEELKNSKLSGGKHLLGVIDFKPDGLVFEESITVTFPLDIHVDPDTVLPIYTRETDEGLFVDSGATCTVDKEGMTCTGEISHFSKHTPVITGIMSNIWNVNRYPHYDENGVYDGESAYYVQDEFDGFRLPNKTRDLPEPVTYKYSKFYTEGYNGEVVGVEGEKNAVIRNSSCLLGSKTEEDIDSFLEREPVLFIHGYQGLNNFGGGYAYWGKFPNLIEELNNEGRRYVTFDYQWASNARFEDVAEDFYYAIKKIYTSMGNRKVHIVAHSFGGIVARTMLQKIFTENEDIDPGALVASLTTIGTPHSGISVKEDSMHGRMFPDGQDSLAFNGAYQISVHQMGESMGPDSILRISLGVQDEVGEIAAKLADFEKNPLPEGLPVLVCIGLKNYYNFKYDKHTYSNGDGLISYEGQRFHPDLTVDGEYKDLLSKQNNFSKSDNTSINFNTLVSEIVLGHEGYFNPIPDENIFIKTSPGYKHSGGTKTPLCDQMPENIVTTTTYANNAAECIGDNPETEHDSFLAVKGWLNKYSSDDLGTIITYPNSSTTWTQEQANTYTEWSGIGGDQVRFEIYKNNILLGDMLISEYHGWTDNDESVNRTIPIPNIWGTSDSFQLKVINQDGEYGWSEYFEIESASEVFWDWNNFEDNTDGWEWSNAKWTSDGRGSGGLEISTNMWQCDYSYETIWHSLIYHEGHDFKNENPPSSLQLDIWTENGVLPGVPEHCLFYRSVSAEMDWTPPIGKRLIYNGYTAESLSNGWYRLYINNIDCLNGGCSNSGPTQFYLELNFQSNPGRVIIDNYGAQ